ncbi:MAG: hypothetical protein ACREVM_00005, partial [Burkholderiales bacterium]
MTRKSLVIALLWAVASRPLLAQDETTPEPDTPAPESASAIAKPDGDGAPATTDSATPPSSAEGDTAPTTNRGASAAAAVGLEELDAILAEEPADP